MDRTGEFLLAVRSSKHIRDERVTTSDIIRPRLMIDPFLQNCMKIYKQMEISKRYIDSYSKEWKTKSVSIDDEAEECFGRFETEVKVLITDLVSQVKSISMSDSTLPLLLKQEVIIDLEDNLKSVRDLYETVVFSHSSYRHMLAILQPSSISNPQVQRTYSIASSSSLDSLLESIPDEEKEQMMSESVLIERELESELVKVKQVERNARELSELVSTFNEQVVEQHDKVETIEDNTFRAKEDVDEGYKSLLKAEENSRGSTMTIALFILAMAIVLILLNYLKW